MLKSAKKLQFGNDDDLNFNINNFSPSEVPKFSLY